MSNSRTLSDFVGSSGTPTFSSNTTFSANVAVTGAAALSNTLVVTGNVVLSNTVAVTGTSIFSNTVCIGASGANNTLLHIRGDWVSGHSTLKVQGLVGETTGIGFYSTSGMRKFYSYIDQTNTAILSGGSNTGVSIVTNDGTVAASFSSNGYISTPRSPAFHMRGPASDVAREYFYGQVVYDRNGNVSSVGSPAKTRFTAPTPGAYVFYGGTIHNNNQSVGVIRLEIYKNGVMYAHQARIPKQVNPSGPEYYIPNVSSSWTVELAKDDYVEFRQNNSDPLWYPDIYTHFGGYLLG